MMRERGERRDKQSETPNQDSQLSDHFRIHWRSSIWDFAENHNSHSAQTSLNDKQPAQFLLTGISDFNSISAPNDTPAARSRQLQLGINWPWPRSRVRQSFEFEGRVPYPVRVFKSKDFGSFGGRHLQ
jgi:hypothetical protein